MFKDTGNGHTNFCLNCELLQRKFDDYKDVKEFEIARYEQRLNEIEEIINNFANEDIITLPDLPKEKNYKFIAEQYAEPIKQILQKIKEVKNEKIEF